MEGDQESEVKCYRVRCLVTLYADVDVHIIPHADGGGAAISPQMPEPALMVNYSIHDLPHELPTEAKAAMATCCAHVMLHAGTGRLARRIKGDGEGSIVDAAPTQAPGSA